MNRARRRQIESFTSDKAQGVERLLALGATGFVWKHEPCADYGVLSDPDGNAFCVVQSRGRTISWGRVDAFPSDIDGLISPARLEEIDLSCMKDHVPSRQAHQALHRHGPAES